MIHTLIYKIIFNLIVIRIIFLIFNRFLIFLEFQEGKQPLEYITHRWQAMHVIKHLLAPSKTVFLRLHHCVVVVHFQLILDPKFMALHKVGLGTNLLLSLVNLSSNELELQIWLLIEDSRHGFEIERYFLECHLIICICILLHFSEAHFDVDRVKLVQSLNISWLIF